MQDEEKRVVFTKASPREISMVRKTLSSNFGPGTLEVLEGGEIYAVKAYWTELHLLRGRVLEMMRVVSRLDRHPYSAGLFLGWIRRGFFNPSLPLIQLVAGKADRGVVVVSEKASMLFIYGRDILCSSIIDVRGGKPRRGQLVIIVNGRGEALGTGVFRGGGRLCVENKLDLGWYLRRAG